MGRLTLVAALAVAIAPITASAQPRAKLPEIKTFTLANGLQVAVVPRDGAPVVAVQVWYRAGSKDERRDRRGTAHMFEHVMFKGSQNLRTDAHAGYINGVGGYVFAQTDEDSTHYVNTLPAEHLDLAIKLEAERMRNLMFRPEAIDAEKAVMKDEIRRDENDPLARAFMRFLEVAFTKHPYAWTSGGATKDVEALTAAELKQFYDAYYQPNNALLVVVGKVSPDTVKASAEKHFGAIAKAPEPPRPAAAAAEPAVTAKKKQTIDPGEVGLTLVGFHLPAAKDPDIYALQVATIVLGVGETSRLKQRARVVDQKTKQPLARDAGIQSFIREQPGVAVVVGAYEDPAAAEPVEAALMDEIGKLAARGPTPDELRKAKNRIQSGFTFSLESAQGFGEAVGRSWILVGDATAFARDIDQIEKVTAADVARVVKKHMAPEKAIVVIIPPKGAK